MLTELKVLQGTVLGDSEREQPEEGIYSRAGGPGDKGSGSQPLLLSLQLVKLSAKLHITNWGGHEWELLGSGPCSQARYSTALKAGRPICRVTASEPGWEGPLHPLVSTLPGPEVLWKRSGKTARDPQARPQPRLFLCNTGHREKHTSLPEQQSMVTESYSQVQA